MCFRLGSCFGGSEDDFGTRSLEPAPKPPRAGNGKAGAYYGPHRKAPATYSDDEGGRKNLHDAPREAENGHAYPADKAYYHAAAAAVAAEAPRHAARNNNNKVGHDHHAAGYRTDHESAMAMVYHYPAPTTNTLARYYY